MTTMALLVGDLYGCFQKIVVPGVPPNHPLRNRVFHSKPSNSGCPYFWKHPYVSCTAFFVGRCYDVVAFFFE